MTVDYGALNWLVNQADLLARGLNRYVTALEEADEKARRDPPAQLPMEPPRVSSEIDISVETIERYILKALPGWRRTRQNDQGEYHASVHASDIAEGLGDKSEWRSVKFLINNATFPRITFYEVVSEDSPRGSLWVRINQRDS